jgi:serine/threonine protein kinase
MPSQQPIDREKEKEKFLKRLRRSGLLSLEQLKHVDEAAAGTARAKDLARTLISRGILTRFQAEMVMAGRTDGFVLGQYRILDQVGRGGMGRVFKAEHMTMNRIVALKVLSNSLTRTDRARQLFQREVRAAAKLVHPNIVTAFDANQTDDRIYLVMEYVDGPNLQELVQELGPVPVGHACDFIRQAALGLHYAFEMGMVHRDIKPANLLLQRGGSFGGSVVKILDFGLARLHEPEPPKESGSDSLPAVEQAVMGTPDFLSPEQAKNLHNVDIRSDVYSLGCTFFYLLTGQVPFPGGTALEKLVRHGSEPAMPVSSLRSDVPPEVSSLVTRLMAKDPENRFQTPMELAVALTPFSVPTSNTFLAPAPAGSGGPMPSGGDSPWAHLDSNEGNALIGTMPPGVMATPMSTTSVVRTSRPSVRSYRRWLLPLALVAGAMVLGLLLGALVLMLT